METNSKGGERFVIVGFGWVGQANAISLKLLGYDVAFYDPGTPPRHYTEHAGVYDRLTRLSAATEWDSNNTWYIICVGDRVTEEGVQDISLIESALASLSGSAGGIILRSTIIPDSLAGLTFDYYVPEFLHEKKAVEESLNPYFFVVGKSEGSRPEPVLFEVLRSRAYKTFNGTPREASFIKYISNMWNSVRIAFVNEIGDAIGRPSDQAKLTEISRILGFMFDNRSYLRYGRAFGGHCLPKDTRAFVGWYGKGKQKLSLLSGTYAANTAHQALEEKFPLMPEWYSEWPDTHISGWKALRELRYAVIKGIKNVLKKLMGVGIKNEKSP